MILNVRFKPCPWVVFLGRNSRFYQFCNYVAKVRRIFETTKLFRDYFSKNHKFLCLWNIFNRSDQKLASKRLYRRISDPRAASSNISGREPQLLSILSVSRLLLCSSFSLSYFWYSFMVRYPPFCPRNIQVFIYSSRTRRFWPFHQSNEFNIIYIIIYIILIWF